MMKGGPPQGHGFVGFRGLFVECELLDLGGVNGQDIRTDRAHVFSVSENGGFQM